MFLATTALTAYWDRSDEILAIGPWCLRYDRKEDWAGLRCTVASSPWKEPRRIEEAAEYCGKVIERLVPDLTVWLNRAHHVHFSERYWRILLGPWLIYSVHAVYDRYVTVKCILESHQGLTTHILSQADYLTPANTADFNLLTSQDHADFFNVQLFSQVFAALKHPGILLREEPLPERLPARHCANWLVCKCTQRDALRSLPARLFRRAASILPRITRPKVMIGGACLNRADLAHLIWGMVSRGGAWPSPLGSCCPVSGRNEMLRQSLTQLPAADEFSRVLIETLPANFPLLFIEGYQSFRKSCLAAWPARPIVCFALDGWYSHETFKFLAAEYGEQGSRLVGGQHGEGYGASKVIPTEDHELAITDRWYSSGWSDTSKAGKIQPLPHPMYLPAGGNKRPRSKEPDQILLVCHSMPRYLHRFESHPPGGRFGEVLEWRERFIQHLPDALRARLLVRLHHKDRGWGQCQRLRDTCGPLQFDDRQRSLGACLAECRLAVTDYRGTALLEMLAENVPVLGFWDPHAYELRKEAQPYFELLQRAEILWESPEAAASKAAAVYADPHGWWHGQALQEARKTFIEQFALARANWLEQWLENLENEIALGSPDGKQGNRHAG